MINQAPESTDLYSEFGAVSRCSRLDFDALQDNLKVAAAASATVNRRLGGL